MVTITGWIGIIIGFSLGGIFGATFTGILVDRYWKKRIEDITNSAKYYYKHERENDKHDKK